MILFSQDHHKQELPSHNIITLSPCFAKGASVYASMRQHLPHSRGKETLHFKLLLTSPQILLVDF
jgi:hypothetical protein